MSVQHQGPCAVSIRELWQQIQEMKANIAELQATLRDERVSVAGQIDTVVDELEREGRRRVSLSSRLSKQAFKVAQVQIMNEYQGIRHAQFTTKEVRRLLALRLRACKLLPLSQTNLVNSMGTLISRGEHSLPLCFCRTVQLTFAALSEPGGCTRQAGAHHGG